MGLEAIPWICHADVERFGTVVLYHPEQTTSAGFLNVCYIPHDGRPVDAAVILADERRVVINPTLRKVLRKSLERVSADLGCKTIDQFPYSYCGIRASSRFPGFDGLDDSPIWTTPAKGKDTVSRRLNNLVAAVQDVQFGELSYAPSTLLPPHFPLMLRQPSGTISPIGIVNCIRDEFELAPHYKNGRYGQLRKAVDRIYPLTSDQQ